MCLPLCQSDHHATETGIWATDHVHKSEQNHLHGRFCLSSLLSFALISSHPTPCHFDKLWRKAIFGVREGKKKCGDALFSTHESSSRGLIQVRFNAPCMLLMECVLTKWAKVTTMAVCVKKGFVFCQRYNAHGQQTAFLCAITHCTVFWTRSPSCAFLLRTWKVLSPPLLII